MSTATFRPPLRNVRRARGFSLVEVLVGVVIGLVGILVMFQTLALFDSRTRTTTSGSDAQVAGTLALFNLDRDLRLAGMGFATAPLNVMGCQVTANDGARNFNFRMRPVQIVRPAVGAPVQIVALYGSSSFFVAPQGATNLFRGASSTFNTKDPTMRAGYQPGDLVIVTGNAAAAAGSANCDLVEITNTVGVLTHAQGNYTSFYAPAVPVAARYNPPGGTGAVYGGNGNLFNLGPAPRLNTWSVVGDVLQVADGFTGAAAAQVAEGVVNLQAQYGVDGNADGQIADAEWLAAGAPDPVDWTTVRAVRLAVLSRSKQFERELGNQPAPNWAGGTQQFVMTNVDGTPDSHAPNDLDPNNWRHYRYRVYESVIPLRNMIWGTMP